MSLGVLNNISAIYAQNNLNQTQSALNNTLQQLSSGSRINSGADDAAGLSLANGLQASSTALSQSAQNASEGVDFLQVADGALSQVTSLLNRAVTLATEASNGTLNTSQTDAANAEYQKILTEINTINSTTEYNGIQSFAQNAAFTVGNANDTVNFDSAAGTADGGGSMTFTLGSNSITIDGTGGTAGAGTVVLGAGSTLSTVASIVNANLGSSVASVIGGQLVLTGGATGQLQGTSVLDATVTPPAAAGGTISVGNANDTLVPSAALSVSVNGGAGVALSASAWGAAGTGGTLSDLAAAINDAAGSSVATISGNNIILGAGVTVSGGTLAEDETVNSSGSNNSVAIFTSDGTISTSYNSSASDVVKADTTALALDGTSLTSSPGAQGALTAINAAITTVAADRGTIGANINTLTAVENVMNTQSTNTLSAENDVTATDYGTATSNMSKDQILMQTGIAALAQAQQSQQLITKLLQ